MSENIIQSPIVEEIEQSFLDYSLSVITDRAIPAVEDGLKPVMRRILWCMAESGYKSNKQYVKCARPVGDTMGKYHPHGDSSIYGALVGASQPWNMRYPLIDFHGNNGSRDGDGPAAMRYTECRLSKIAEATLENIKKDTVDWIPNFDETLKEPVYLPGIFPNLLCNGTTGIAVAMACSFAPHNLTEVMNAIIAYVKGEALTSADLVKYINGPDFPTGGIIINQKELVNAYLTGKGRVKIRGEYKVEKTKQGAEVLVFTSIPYKVSKENLLTEIDTLCEEKKINGIVEIRDESNKEGVRFVIELAKGQNADIIANQLYELTNLESTFNINQVALENKTPKQMTLADIIKNYVEHQKDVFRRLNEYQKKQLEHQIHILSGLCKALDDIDNVIQLIKSSADKSAAHKALMAKYDFSSEQADAILSMTLSRLANMEKIALEKDLEKATEDLGIILSRLNNAEVFNTYLIDCLESYKNTYADARRTKITNIEITKEEKEIAQIVPEDVIVIMTEAGNIKRVPKKNFKSQKRNGKGIKTQDDCTLGMIDTNTIDVIMAFTDRGRVYRLPVDQIPEGTQLTRGVAISTLIQTEVNEKVVVITSAARNETDKYVWFVTKSGLIKKTNINEYNTIGKRKTGVQAIGLRNEDELCSIWIGGNSDILVITRDGMGIRFDGTAVSTVGRTAAGVQAIKLNSDDKCVFGGPIFDDEKYNILVGYTNGTGLLLSGTEFTRQGRAGKGLKITKDCRISTVCSGFYERFYIAGSNSGICVTLEDIPRGSRNSAPIKLIKNSDITSIIGV